MSGLVALPLLIAIGITPVGASRVELLGPAAAARSLAVLLGAVLAAAVPTLWLLGFGGLAHLGVRIPFFDWCRHFLPEERIVGGAIGLLSLGAAIAGTVRVRRVMSLHWRLRVTDTCACEIIDDEEFASPPAPIPHRTVGRRGGAAARVLAARTIAKVALAGVATPLLLGLAHHGTAARAAALLEPIASPTTFARMQATVTTTLMVAVAAIQVLRTITVTAGLVA